MHIASHSRFWSIIGLLVVDGLFFTLTNPAQVPSSALIIGFSLFTGSLYFVARGLLMASGWYGLPFAKHRQRLARVITGVTAGLIALQSIGQLSSRDITVLVPLVVLAYLYTVYGQRAQNDELQRSS